MLPLPDDYPLSALSEGIVINGVYLMEVSMDIPMQECMLSGNSEHSFPKEQYMPFRYECRNINPAIRLLKS